jgi:hypothetical protein
MVLTFNPGTWEAEADGSLSSRPHGLQSEFQDSQRATQRDLTRKTKVNKLLYLTLSQMTLAFSGFVILGERNTRGKLTIESKRGKSGKWELSAMAKPKHPAELSQVR